ncbi:ATP-dependent zinc metalloprotease FtsH [Seohaeicola zhoushanensis]|uniref:ATP-dependent zinc metalloprotease FtsH n=1 Tax=Seohaeicola zhoushanensis TaxID=1569283 RepID=A0A8J3GX69_9RHOB|nr:ATP-dependent zinc metalloprotease FtsH [Seohaeicola zhoushanensis]GHF52359.1 ATP-dependent zinc metalloprotease FtsH [Seohaeicola zhoushanensis]
MDKHKANIAFAIFAFLIVLGFQYVVALRTVATIDYSTFLENLRDGKIAHVTVTEGRIEGAYKQPEEGKPYFVTLRVEPGFAAELDKAGVRFDGASDSNWLTSLLSWILPTLFFLAVWAFVFRRFAERQGMGGLVSIGKSRAKLYVEKDTGVTFDDVAGVDEAKAELQEVVSFLNDRDRYSRLGARIPKGILLVGPPGTGKTLLARAIAGEAGVPFFSISGSEFVEMFVGVGAARVRDLFEQARKAAPCIIFIDELDALGRARTAMGGLGGADEKEQTLNQLLAELDGFDPSVGVVLLGATNRPEILDPALLRSGRFDRQIVVDRPDRTGREAILAVHVRKVKLADGVRLAEIAGITAGMTGADLANVVNEAAITATRRGAKAVDTQDLTAAVERIVAGTERRTRVLGEKERHRVAVHEMGHALAAANLPGADPVHKVSIIPRSIGALGYTLQRPTEDRFLITFDELKDRMTVLMAGRAAEALEFGVVSTGASDDLAKATDIARDCVTRFGMSETVGQAVLETQRLQWLGAGQGDTVSDYSEETAREVDLAVRDLIEEAFASAKALLSAHRDDLTAGTNLLMQRETLTPDDFPALRPGRAAIAANARV